MIAWCLVQVACDLAIMKQDQLSLADAVWCCLLGYRWCHFGYPEEMKSIPEKWSPIGHGGYRCHVGYPEDMKKYTWKMVAHWAQWFWSTTMGWNEQEQGNKQNRYQQKLVAHWAKLPTRFIFIFAIHHASPIAIFLSGENACVSYPFPRAKSRSSHAKKLYPYPYPRAKSRS